MQEHSSAIDKANKRYDQYKQLGKEDFLDYLQLIGIKYSDSRKNILESLIDVCKNYNVDVKKMDLWIKLVKQI